MAVSCFLCSLLPMLLLQELEKHPLEVVPAEPSELLDRDRYQRSSRDLVSWYERSASVTVLSAPAGACWPHLCWGV